jgi:23S rRNA (uracil1939-C5)-methyltransferase
VVVKAILPAYGGYTIAREDKVMLIKGAIPGEVVEVTITEKKRDYTLAVVTRVVEPSEDRVEPPCPVFGICGGCQLQFVSYEKQLRMKEEVLVDSLSRLGGIEIALAPSLSGRQWNYRHRAQFKVSREGRIGFFRESTRDVVVFDSCPLMVSRINEILRKVKEMNIAETLREIHLAIGDEAVALLKGGCDDDSLIGKFREAGISGISCNDALLEGAGYALFDLHGLKYSVSPWTFFQANWDLNATILERLMREIMPCEGKAVLDLYAGAGNFSLPLASLSSEIVAVEENPRAVDDGIRNLRLNSVKNVKFVRSAAEKYRIQKKFDIIILDPPRPGLTSEVMKKVLQNRPDSLVYISCNQSTFARDLRKLKESYDVSALHLIDFFPNTFHIETVAFLRVR